jgi:hypothetical protein
MPKQQKWTRMTPLALVALAVLALPTSSTAQTDQNASQTHAARIAKLHPKRHVAVRQRYPYARRHLYGWDERSMGGCQNATTPCLSTFPEGSPHYHGPQYGPTFDNQ